MYVMCVYVCLCDVYVRHMYMSVLHIHTGTVKVTGRLLLLCLIHCRQVLQQQQLLGVG